MKTIKINEIFFLIIVVGIVSAFTLDNILLDVKQKYVTQLLDHITEPIYNEELKNISNSFIIENNVNLFNRVENVKTFLAMKRKRMLPKGEIFCLYCHKHIEEAIVIFNVLYDAKDFPTFLATASWMRSNINEMIFLYAFSVAIRHRNDCNGINLPPIYETYPFIFISKKTLNKIFVDMMTQIFQMSNIIEDIYDTNWNYEHNLRYFTNDIGLSSYLYNFYLDYPFWMTDDIYGLDIDRRGELYIYVHKQLVARYNLERNSFKYCEVIALNPTQLIELKYDPSVVFHNGWNLPSEHRYLNLYKEKYDLVRDLDFLEFQIKDAVFKGVFVTSDGKFDIQKKEALEVLGRRIYGTLRKNSENPSDDINFITKTMFGLTTKQLNGYDLPSSTFQFNEISFRNPIFWNLQKYLLNLVDKFRNKLWPYKRDDLYYYDVEITKVDVSPLITFLEYGFMDVSNLLSRPIKGESINKTKLIVKKRRLNNKPFSLTINIYSRKQEDAVVRIYLAPKVDCGGYNLDSEENFQSFLEIDVFKYNLKEGNNTIVRLSENMNNIFQINFTAKENQYYYSEYHNNFTGFPSNLIVPRGSKYGHDLKMFIIVNNVSSKRYPENHVDQFLRKKNCRFTLCIDDRPLGYPFDRKWDFGFGLLPNAKMVDITIFHRNTFTSGL